MVFNDDFLQVSGPTLSKKNETFQTHQLILAQNLWIGLRCVFKRNPNKKTTRSFVRYSLMKRFFTGMRRIFTWKSWLPWWQICVDVSVYTYVNQCAHMIHINTCLCLHAYTEVDLYVQCMHICIYIYICYLLNMYRHIISQINTSKTLHQVAILERSSSISIKYNLYTYVSMWKF